jgi:hypothetical protein
MINDELLDYIEKAIKKGEPTENIKASLFSGGWNSDDLDEAFRAVSASHIPSIPIAPKPQIVIPPVIPATPAPVISPASPVIPIVQTKPEPQASAIAPNPTIAPTPASNPTTPIPVFEPVFYTPPANPAPTPVSTPKFPEAKPTDIIDPFADFSQTPLNNVQDDDEEDSPIKTEPSPQSHHESSVKVVFLIITLLLLIVALLAIYFFRPQIKKFLHLTETSKIEEQVYGDGLDNEKDLAVLDQASVPNPSLDEMIRYDGKPLGKDQTNQDNFMAEEAKWAYAENGMPKGWKRWADTVDGVSVEKKGPTLTNPSYIISISGKLLSTFTKTNKCVGDGESAFCIIGNDPEVLRYWNVASFYY